MSNPWSQIDNYNGMMYASTDKIFLKQNKLLENNNLHLDLWPEPFIGHKDADLYLLNGNPGFDDKVDKKVSYDNDYKNWIKSTYQEQQLSTAYPGCNDFLFLNNPKDLKCQNIGGFKWWQQRLKVENVSVFNIEFFPYHTKDLKGMDRILNGYANPDNKTAFEYTGSLVQNAISNGKPIILMRLKEKWLGAIKDLKTYDKLFILSNTQNVTISKNNILHYSTFLSAKQAGESKLNSEFPGRNIWK